MIWDYWILPAAIHFGKVTTITKRRWWSALNGCRFPKGKKAVLTVLLCQFVAAAPYELVVLIVNTLIHHGLRPLYSITVSSFVQSGIVILCAVLTIIFLARGAKRKDGTEA